MIKVNLLESVKELSFIVFYGSATGQAEAIAESIVQLSPSYDFKSQAFPLNDIRDVVSSFIVNFWKYGRNNMILLKTLDLLKKIIMCIDKLWFDFAERTDTIQLPRGNSCIHHWRRWATWKLR